MDFDRISKGIMFLFDNYENDEELSEYIENIDGAESDNDIKVNVRKIIEILKNRVPHDRNIGVIEELFKGFI